MTQAKPEKKQIPLRRGRFKIPEQGTPYLVASKCQSCGKYFFPTRVICLNCGKQTMIETPLKGKGTIYTYTVARQQLPGALMKPPYAIANVLMEEGCQVPTVITENWETLDIGTDVEVYFEKIQEDAEGNDLMVYKFRQIKKK
jgi:uncharacterized OB-fold protein